MTQAVNTHSLGTNLRGRVRNVSLAASNGLMPLFEAVSNSIHAIEDAGHSTEAGRITIAIVRSSPGLLDAPDGKPPLGEIEGFTISDNGVGFNEANFNSFRTLDSDHKVHRGGRGVGRLLWLKAFDRVDVDSLYTTAAGDLKRRRFAFDATNGVSGGEPEPRGADAAPRTTIRLTGFRERYRRSSVKTARAIGIELVEHCLWFFVRPGSTPRISIEDEGERLDLHDIFEELMHAQAVSEQVSIKGESFELLHVKQRAKGNATHVAAYCADDRVVTTDKLAGKIPGVHGRLTDQGGDFVYACYVSSPLLNRSARPERSSFDISDDVGDLFGDSEVSWDDIRREVRSAASAHLADQIQEARSRTKARVEQYVNYTAPRYRPVLGRISIDALSLDPHVTDKELELALHRQLAEIERSLVAEGHDLLAPQSAESEATYRQRVAEYLKKADDIKKSDLANYVTHRRVVVELLREAVKRLPDGSYNREDLIHTLIMPMVKDSTEVLLDNCNLWLIDERLAFHDYLASDKPLCSMPITDSPSKTEPDLLALNVFDNPVLVSDTTTPPYASITVVELKKPMKAAALGEKNDPVEQALNYLHRIRQSKVTTAEGRPIPNAGKLQGFCYVICDLTSHVAERCKMQHGLDPTSDGMGFFGWKKGYEAYVVVMSYDGLVKAAIERNRAFFDKLGLPAN